MTAVSMSGRIELADPDFVDSLQTYSGLHAVSPLLIGFSLPALAVSLFVPRGPHVLHALALAVLVFVGVVAALVFLVCVLNHGRIAAVVFDIGGRTLELLTIGSFARRVETVPFSDISNVRVVTRYNREGRSTVSTEAVLRTGEVMVLPVAPSAAELHAVRLALAALAH